MKKIKRVKAALAGEAVDRPPYSFWTHLPGTDLHPKRLAAETAAFAERYDLDFVKSMPNGLYSVEDWGGVCDYTEIERGGTAKVVEPAVKMPDEWPRLARLDVTRGSFGRELDHYAELTRRMGPDVPVIATVFSPLTTAGKLSDGAVRAHSASDAQALHAGLEVITEVTCGFVREAIALGCAGVFFAIQDATHSAYGEDGYRRLGEPYDRRVLQAASAAGGWFNVVHLHGEDVLFDVIRRYNTTALNWHIGETTPSIADYRGAGGDKPILGGLRRANITAGDREGIERDIESAYAESGGAGLLLAPACVIRHPVDDETLRWTADRIQALAKTPA